MAVPKRKTSKARRDKRRASNIKMTAPQVIKCPQCHEPNMPHRVCAACGYYKNREVISVEA
jgi:large subunit ribosomal protein L32